MLKTVDLFAGAGGLSCGFESTGQFEIVAAAENNPNAQKTYLHNHKGNNITMISDVRGYNFGKLSEELYIPQNHCPDFSLWRHLQRSMSSLTSYQIPLNR